MQQLMICLHVSAPGKWCKCIAEHADRTPGAKMTPGDTNSVLNPSACDEEDRAWIFAIAAGDIRRFAEHALVVDADIG